VETESGMKTFLRWAGSKRQLLPHLKKYIPSTYKRYIEPFAGSACLFFDLAPSAAIIGDVNSDLINTYKTIRRHWKQVAGALEELVPCEKTYYDLRSCQPNFLSRTERAARFIYLNRFCFNGLYRTNNQGEFNVPFGGEGTGRLPTHEELREAASLLRHATLVDGSFEASLSMVRKGDFVYMDPPYVRKHKRSFTEYAPSEFGVKELFLLRRWMESLKQQNIPFLVTYTDCAEARMLSRGFRCDRVQTRRCISGFVNSRKSVWEVIIRP
jgi:DNA adenine methylase